MNIKLAVSTLIGCLCIVSICSATPLGLLLNSGAADFAVLGLQNTFINLHNVSVHGDVGVSSGGKLAIASPSTVYGDVFIAPGVIPSGPGKIVGDTFTRDMSPLVTASILASTQASGLVATQTFGNITSGFSIVGNGGLNVIAIDNINLGGSDNLLFSGTANDIFIVNISGKLTLNGSAQVGPKSEPSGTQLYNVLYNFTSSGCQLSTKVDNVINGIVLAPNCGASEMHGAVGTIIYGGTSLKLMSGAEVFHPEIPPPPPGGEIPEPSTAGLVGASLLVCAHLLRRRASWGLNRNTP